MEKVQLEGVSNAPVGAQRRDLARRLAILMAIAALLFISLFWLAILTDRRETRPAESTSDPWAKFAARRAANKDKVARVDQKSSQVGGPKEEIFLVNYDDLVQDNPELEPPSELDFIGEMLANAMHNMAALSGEQSYFKRQWPFKTSAVSRSDDSRRRRQDEVSLESLLPDFDDIFISNGAGAQDDDDDEIRQLLAALGEEDFVAGSPGPELKKVNLVSQWFSRFFGGKPELELPNYPLDQQPDPDRITHIDADLRNCTGPIKDQLGCGACYAFSWLALVEWHYCRQTGGSIEKFSEQHLIDCCQPARLTGCSEGKLSWAKSFTQEFGLHFERDYIYKGHKGNCRARRGNLGVHVTDFRPIKVEREEFERVLEEQPIVLVVHLPRDIDQYSSGIHPGHNCQANGVSHAMLLVGHGRQAGQPYWLLRNSMGRRWGEGGYLRLSRDLPDMGACFGHAFVASFRFQNLAEEKNRDFYDSLKYQPERAPDGQQRSTSTDLSELLRP